MTTKAEGYEINDRITVWAFGRQPPFARAVRIEVEDREGFQMHIEFTDDELQKLIGSLVDAQTFVADCAVDRAISEALDDPDTSAQSEGR
jgi:hypothetical protein